MQPISRSQARAIGARHYVTGKACAQGHVAPRYTSTGNCTECQRERVSARTPEVSRRYAAEFAARHPESVKASKRADYWANKTRRKATATAWKHANKDRVVSWKQENRHKACEYAARRKARRLNATPKWADAGSIQRVYRQAQLANAVWPGLFEVDHIVPLIGRTVCGLHVEANLRVVDIYENRSKGSSWTRAIARKLGVI